MSSALLVPHVWLTAHGYTEGEIIMYFIIRMSFIARYVYTYKEFVFVTEVTTVQQNETKTQIIKRRIKKNK